MSNKSLPAEVYDFMGSRPQDTGTDITRQLREAENVLSSYSHATDFLAEALQNAADAVDARRIAEPNCPARIEIRFDCAARSFTVADTGTGMSPIDARQVLRPNVTLKAGQMKRVKGARSRGEKGVGLSFLALGANRLTITTCDASHKTEVVVEGGNRWVATEGKTPKPMARSLVGPPNQYLGSTRYTIVSVADLDPEEFDTDLFDTTRSRLMWDLRTRTAVGNTAPVFGRRPANDIDVGLTFISADGKESRRHVVPYAYATPEELVPAELVTPFAQVARLATEAKAAETRGRAVRYRGARITSSGHRIGVYAFAMDGKEMLKHLRPRKKAGHFAPDEWQGFWVATRDMPTHVDFVPEKIQPRTYHRRIFALFQDDEIKLDLGRKTLAGRTKRMFKDVAEAVWFDDLQGVVQHIGSSEEDGGLKAALDAAIRRAKNLPELDADVPYLKEPAKWQGVMALFHELIAARSVLPELRTLRTGVFTDADALLYAGQPNGKDPLHVLFGRNAKDLLANLEGDPNASTAQLAVLWELGLDQLVGRRIEARAAAQGADGATHELVLGGIANRQSLRCIVLTSLLAKQDAS